VRGTLAADTVSLAGYTVQSQTFAIIDELAQGTLRAPASALMGMGFQQLASSGATPFWQVLAQSNQLQQPLFTFQLARNNQNPTVLNAQTLADQLQPGGVFTLGELDSNQYEGDITYTSLTSRAYWTIPMDSLNVNGRTTSLSSSENVAAIDTGTTLVAGPPSVVRSIYEQIPGSVTAPMGGDDSSIYYAFPCSTTVQVSLTFSGKAWSINSADFNYGLYGRQGNTNYCLGAFFGTDIGQGAPDWIVGDAFLKNVFSIYDSNPARVGFASLRGNTAQTLATTTGAIRQATATAAPASSGASSSSVAPAILPSNSADNTASGNVGGSGLPAPTPGTTIVTQTASLMAGPSQSGSSSSGSGSGRNAGARSAGATLSSLGLVASSLFLGALAVLL
jgi:cathepsin D